MTLNREQVIQTAEKLVSRGKIDAAIKEYRKLLNENPGDASTLNRLGDLFVRLDKIDEAVRLFSQIAERYTEDGFFVKAIAIFKKIIKLDPTRLSVYERLADLYHKQGLVNEARTQYQVLVDYHMKHAGAAAAINILTRMATLEPDDPGPHVKLAELYQQEGQGDKALAEHRTIAELMVRHGRIDEATQVYMKAVEAAPNDIAFITDAVLGLKDGGHVAAAARLLSLAVERNPQAEKIARIAGLGVRGPGEKVVQVETPPAVQRVSDVVSTPPEIAPSRPFAAPRASAAPPTPTRGSAAPPTDEPELIIELPEEEAAGSTEIRPTEDMLRRSPDSPWYNGAESGEIELDLDMAGLEGLESLDLGVAAPAPPPPKAPEAGRPAAPALRDLGAEPELPSEIDWQLEPVPELDLELPEPPAPPPAAAAPRPFTLDVEELARSADEVAAAPPSAARRPEDLLAEAEVLAKYGLREKAQERVREVLQLEPRSLEANALAATLLLEEGRHDRVLARAAQLADLAAEQGDERVWPALRQKLAKAGYRFEGERPVGGPVAAAAKKDRLSALLADLAEVAPKRPKAAAPKPPAGVESALGELASRVAKRAAAPKPAPPAPKPPAAPPVVTPPLAGALVDEEELPGIVLPLIPSGRAAAPPAPPASPKPPEALPPLEVPSLDESLSWLDKVVAEPETEKAGATKDEKLFEDEEGFFDLAAELEHELSQEDLVSGKELIAAAPQEQTLEEIVEGFKKGVAESLSSEDYDTHYNLGIAYREMGLLDEAIGEFQLAAKDPKYLIDCCSLLGMCFLEKGIPELAVKWYQRALEVPGLAEDVLLGLLYDLGNVYMSMHDVEKARKTFVEIYGVNSNYRDVVAKLEELGHT